MLERFYNQQICLAFDKQQQLGQTKHNYYQIKPEQTNVQNHVVEVIPETDPHNNIYENQSFEPEHETLEDVVSVRTLQKPEFKPNYFFGDSLGVLPCRNCNRSLETIEASITFDEEPETANTLEARENVIDDEKDEEKEDDYAPIVTNTLTKNQILEIFCQLD